MFSTNEKTNNISETSNQIVWSIKDVSLGILSLFVVNIFIGAIFAVATKNFKSHPLLAIAVVSLTSFVLTIFLAWWLTVHKYHINWSDLGLHYLSLTKILPFVFLTEVVVLFIINFYGQLVFIFTRAKIPRQPVVELFGRSSFGLTLAALVVVVLAPIGEEIFFRGFVFAGLKKYWGVAWGAVVSSAIFALFHLNGLLFIPLFIIGVALAWLYEFSGSILPSIMLHIINNLLALTYIYLSLR